MKKILILMLVLFTSQIAHARTTTVKRVIDGNTIKLTNGEEVRLIGIEISEDEKTGQEAVEFVKELIEPGQEVRLEFDMQERDKDGRLLAYVYQYVCGLICDLAAEEGEEFEILYSPDGTYRFVNATIIKSGYATPMTGPPNATYADLFKELYEEAREKKRGLWKQKIFFSKESFIKKLTEGMTQDNVVAVFGQPEEYACGEGGLRPIVPQHPENECWIYRVKGGWFVDVYFSGEDKRYVTWSQSNFDEINSNPLIAIFFM